MLTEIYNSNLKFMFKSHIYKLGLLQHFLEGKLNIKKNHLKITNDCSKNNNVESMRYKQLAGDSKKKTIK